MAYTRQRWDLRERKSRSHLRQHKLETRRQIREKEHYDGASRQIEGQQANR